MAHDKEDAKKAEEAKLEEVYEIVPYGEEYMYEKKGNIRYGFTGKLPITTIWQYIDRQFSLMLAWFWPFDFLQLTFPLFIDILGSITQTSDANGNNFTNWYTLLIEENGAWGVFKYYNMFNLAGWFAAFFDFIFAWVKFQYGWSIVEVIILLSTGELKVDDF